MLMDKYDTLFSFYLWGLNYAIIIMTVIWLNHFVLIPYLFDKKRYFLYRLLFLGSIFKNLY